MYAFIWRHLPFGLPGKIIGSLLLVAAASAALWYGVFPAAEPLLPFGDVQVTDNNGPGGPGDPGRPSGGVLDPSESVPADGVIPYPTGSNNSPHPSSRPSR